MKIKELAEILGIDEMAVRNMLSEKEELSLNLSEKSSRISEKEENFIRSV